MFANNLLYECVALTEFGHLILNLNLVSLSYFEGAGANGFNGFNAASEGSGMPASGCHGLAERRRTRRGGME